MTQTETAEKIYEKVADEDGEHPCAGITEDACEHVPANFLRIIIASTLTKLGDALSNPKTVLAWLMTILNAPAAFIGFLVPVRESGSLIPQLFIAGYVQQLAKRKWVWVTGSLVQCAAVVGLGVTAMTTTGVRAGWLIIGLLALFSLARGFCSVSSKDVLGKTIPKHRRGRVNGLGASISGLLTLGVALYLLMRSEEASNFFYGLILILAGSLWLAAAAVYATIKEFRGEIEKHGNILKATVKRLSIIKSDKQFRHFVVTRALLLCTALSAPFYVVLAQEQYGTQIYLLGSFILANGLAASMSATVWGSMADRSSKRVMLYAVLLASLLGIVMFLVVNLTSRLRELVWVYPLAFFVLGIAHSGVRVGRKTYIVDMASGNKRTDYVAVSNSIIGVILLLTGVLSAMSTFLAADGIILAFSILGILAAISGWRLPEVE